VLDSISLLVLDVDGVLADGRIVLDSRGLEVKTFHCLDGQGLKYWLRAGHRAALLSGRESKAVSKRAAELGIKAVYMGAKDKLPVFETILKRFRTSAAGACYVGDDLVDIPPMARAGFAVAPANAVDEVKRLAHYVTKADGGAGAVRETIELILTCQGLWDKVTRRYQDRLPSDLPAPRNPWRDRP
jgi:3-deoxy-D-manno-octulosonate 8-phosphate phosphatase (KDO 8-P phosphatase)